MNDTIASRLGLLSFALALLACGDDGATPGDATMDGALDSGPDVPTSPAQIPWLDEAVPPLALTPCSEGWREVVVGGVTECDAYPEGGPASCTEGEAHFPGEPRCRPIGDACPASEFASSLPTDAPVIYVSSTATPGGDGSLGAPYASLADVAWATLTPGATVALGKGTYEGAITVREGVRVVGACVAETVISGESAPGRAAITASSGDGTASIENLTVRATAQHGVILASGLSLRLRRVLVDQGRDAAIIAIGAMTALELDGAVIRDTQPRALENTFGIGVVAASGAALSMTDSVIEGSHYLGLFTTDAGTMATLTNVSVRDTRPQVSDLRDGRGVAVHDQAEFTATGLSISGNHDLGMAVAGVGTRVTLDDTTIRGTLPQASDSTAGRGLNVQAGTEVVATRLLVADNHGIGIYASGLDASLLLSDAVIRDTQPQASDGSIGRGIAVQRGADLEATRALLDGNHDIGLFVSGEGAMARLTDVAVKTTRPPLEGGPSGRGIHAQLGARVDGDRILVGDSHEYGVIATGDGLVELRDVAIRSVVRAACASSTCPELPHGHGVTAAGSTVRLTRFEIRGAETCGVLLAPLASAMPTAMDLQDGLVTMSEIGACAQVEGYDLGRLQSNVAYVDNGSALDSTSLPVPEPLEGLPD